jgi:hypothetical protein
MATSRTGFRRRRAAWRDRTGGGVFICATECVAEDTCLAVGRAVQGATESVLGSPLNIVFVVSYFEERENKYWRRARDTV